MNSEPRLIRKNAGKTKKSVSFELGQNSVGTTVEGSPGSKSVEPSIVGRPEIKRSPVRQTGFDKLKDSPIRCSRVTRLMSPKKPAAPSDVESSPKDVTSISPRRSPRLATSEATMSRDNSTLQRVKRGEDETGTETEAHRRCRELIQDCPSFELGIEDDLEEAGCKTEVKDDVKNTEEEIIVVSSNNDSADSLDEIFARVEMPIKTPTTEKLPEAEVDVATPAGPSSCTPVPQAHQKRVLKPSKSRMSPFMDIDKKSVSRKFTNDVYDRICKHGGKPTDKEAKAMNGEKIVDDGVYYIYLGDLADSVKPGALLSNSTCEMALRVLSKEVEKQKKHVMPLWLTEKLRKATCIHDKAVKNMFKPSAECRLDHKELIMFPVFQDLTPDIQDVNGHYYLIVLNVKAERFEVMDLLRRKANKGLMDDAKPIIGSIKHLWGLNYEGSSIDIGRWKTEHIVTPMQKTNFDCGYFMLKFIELWTGRQMLALNPAEMPIIRKFLLQKWLEWVDNKVAWQELIF